MVKSEPEALLLEGKLIKEYKPRYNAMFKDDKRFLMVKVSLNEPYPRFKFARLKKDDGARYFGPFAHAGSVRLAMQWIRKKYGVLVQGTGAPKEKDLKYSTYLVPVPLKDMPREEYLRRVELACDFLEGRNKEAVGQLEQEMQQAAKEMQFEKAAQLRDVIGSLREIARAARERKFARDFSQKIDPQAEMEELRRVLNLPTLAAAHRGIRHFQHQRHALRRVNGLFPRRPTAQGTLPSLPDQDGRRQRRFRFDGRGGGAPVRAGAG